MKMSTRAVRIFALALGAVAALLPPLQALLESGQPITLQALVMAAGGALVGYALKAPGTFTQTQVDVLVAQARAAVVPLVNPSPLTARPAQLMGDDSDLLEFADEPTPKRIRIPPLGGPTGLLALALASALASAQGCAAGAAEARVRGTLSAVAQVVEPASAAAYAGCVSAGEAAVVAGELGVVPAAEASARLESVLARCDATRAVFDAVRAAYDQAVAALNSGAIDQAERLAAQALALWQGLR